MRYYNNVIISEITEGLKWRLVTHNKIISGKGKKTFEAELLKFPQDKKIIIYDVKLNRSYSYLGEEFFDFSAENKTYSGDSRFIRKNNIEFRDMKKFCGKKIKEMANDLGIDYKTELAQSYEIISIFLKQCYNKSFRSLPATSTGFIRRRIDSMNLNLGNLAFDKERYDIYKQLQGGALCGCDKNFLGIDLNVFGYDIKSDYPFIMSTMYYPSTKGTIIRDVSLEKFNKLVELNIMMVANITFKKITCKPYKINWINNLKNNTMSFTNLDIQMLYDAYDFEIEKINNVIFYAEKKRLPNELRNMMLDLFKIKESKKGTIEYNSAKRDLNAIFGLFYCDPFKYDDNADLQCISQKNRPMIIGFWTVSYARIMLYKVMKNTSVVYWDTDGFKTLHPIDDIIEKDNQCRLKWLKKAFPKISDDIKIGQWENECVLEDFTCYGCKQYYLGGHLHCAGLDSELADMYFEKQNRRPKLYDVIPKEYSGRRLYLEGEVKELQYTLGGQFEKILNFLKIMGEENYD